MGRYLPINVVMRRKPGSILPLEAAVLEAAVELAKAGVEQFHGFELAKHLRNHDGQRSLTAHGTLYKALSRMEKAGLLSSVWEDPDIAADEGRPRRRLYSVTPEGRVTLARVQSAEADTASPGLDPGLRPS
jgi:PadR family transcriptional regulator PadR